MPIFEFACNACQRKRFSELVGVVQDAPPVRCPQCGSADVRKLVSRFARKRSEEQALESLAELADSVDPGDPRALRRQMKELAHGIDEDLSGGEIDALMDEALETEGTE